MPEREVSGDTTRPEDGLAPPEDDVPVVFDDEAIEVPPATLYNDSSALRMWARLVGQLHRSHPEINLCD